ncbi:HAD-superfamily subfamily IB hydrolase, TIGR01490 [Marinospirillum celere]|uniref:Histidinol-phosphatase n=1 Tax=Marinospirillum celere TaxID=1122252 RepID=A0A1I1ITN7_9GAMM|nr:HAD family hydrolase [Marinospirillum celere]SFC39657.1 HAD-superfamily subfamily IB hydrolase, TIGR01490 [Marinospirillum celere]
MNLALFDLDNTLIAGDSDHAWGEFLVAKKLVDAQEYKEANDRYLAAYQEGTLDIHEYLSFSLRPLTRYPAADLYAWRQEFVEQWIQPLVLDKGLKLLEQHRNQGDQLVIITATNRFITAPIAELLGVKELIAVEPEMLDGRYTGKIVGTPSFREGKITCLEEWLDQHQLSLEGSHFYSDSHNDLPLLKKVANPVAVDPDNELQAYAQQQGWPVISLR